MVLLGLRLTCVGWEAVQARPPNPNPSGNNSLPSFVTQPPRAGCILTPSRLAHGVRVESPSASAGLRMSNACAGKLLHNGATTKEPRPLPQRRMRCLRDMNIRLGAYNLVRFITHIIAERSREALCTSSLPPGSLRQTTPSCVRLPAIPL